MVSMENRVVTDFDFVGYREHLFKKKAHIEKIRDEYCRETLMWGIYNNMVIVVQGLIDDMDDYATFKE